ncbi:MAG: FAD-binding protein [Thermodesulfobacteriota bacterium]|nr:FAD-binding protein [Thermodesulfobacteriota bacterium]
MADEDLRGLEIFLQIAGRVIDGKDYLHLDLTHPGKEVLDSKLSEISGFAKTYAGIDPVIELTFQSLKKNKKEDGS